MRTTAIDDLQTVLTRELTYGILPKGSRDPQPSASKTAGNVYQYDFQKESILESQHFPYSWVRGAILIRINSLIRARSAVRPVIVERLRDMLLHDLIPMIPLRGSISASGDLSPLAYVGGVIQGKSSIRLLPKDGQQELYADTGLRAVGLSPIRLGPKEGLAIVNGTAMSAAAGALAIHDTTQLVFLAQILTAMSVEALAGNPESFDPLFARTRPHPGQVCITRSHLR